MQDRSGTIFGLLASVACGSPRLGNISSKHRLSKHRLTRARLAGLISKPVLDIEYQHILSLDVVLNKGLELASYNKEAWTHILRLEKQNGVHSWILHHILDITAM